MKLFDHRFRRMRRYLGRQMQISRRGAIVVMSVTMVSIASITVANEFLKNISGHYRAVRASADGLRAREVALAGFQASLQALKTIPEEYLYRTGIVTSPKERPLARSCVENDPDNCEIYFVGFRILPEDGRLNLNSLVRYDDKPNESYRRIMANLFRNLDIPDDGGDPNENVDAVIDWIDENGFSEGVAAESEYYSSLQPSRKIKNFRMFSLSELPQVRGFSYDLVYGSRAPEGWQERQEELSFQTEDEINLIQPEDWVLANNVTAFLPYTESTDDKVNVNAARYHVMLSLSDAMTREAALAIFKYRTNQQGYIKTISELKELPELQIQGGIPDLTLYQELAGTGGDISGLLKTEGEYYRVVGLGSVVRTSDNGSRILAERQVWGIWDKTNRRLIYYSED